MSAQAETSITSSRDSGSKSLDLLTCTIRTPPFSYVRLELVSADPTSTSQKDSNGLDELQIKSYCAAACRQFMGLTGAAIPMDILKVDGTEFWLRVPRQDLGTFSAAVTTWRGAADEESGRVVLRVKQCSDWLGMMIGTSQQDQLWGS